MFSIKFIQTLLDNKKIKPFIIPAVVLLVGIVIFGVFSAPYQSEEARDEIDVNKYAAFLEKKLESNIEKLNAVYDCNVLITVSALEQNEYLENKSVTSTLGEKNEEYSREEQYLVIDNGGGDDVVIKSRKMPEIRGALVVYSGRDDINTKKDIIDAVSVVLGIKSNKVCVVANLE